MNVFSKITKIKTGGCTIQQGLFMYFQLSSKNIFSKVMVLVRISRFNYTRDFY